MRLRTWAEFTADFPYDGIEDEDGFVEFPGRGIAQAMIDMLRSFGYEVSAPEHQFENGWDFEAKIERKRIWMNMTAFGGSEAGDECLFRSYGSGGLFDRRRTLDVHAEVLTHLSGAMAKDGRFSKVRWLFEAEVNSDVPGSPTPVAE